MFFTDTIFFILQKNIIKNRERKLKQVYKFNHTKVQQNYLKRSKPTAPKIRAFPKVHKQNVPLRPLVNLINSPTYELS